MRATTRKLVKSLVPHFIRELRNNRIAKEIIRQQKLEKKLHSAVGGVILSGPFQGLFYSDDSCGSMLGPKLLGIYEKEIHSVIQEIIATQYEHIIDVGAAEGYYAVGLLKVCHQSVVTGFESSPEGRKSLLAMAARNGLSDRLTVLGFCDVDALSFALRGQSKELIICDVEGFEKELLDPVLLPRLRDVNILVEVHDFVDINISSTLRERFADTHEIRCFQSVGRKVADLPVISGFSTNEMMCVASERRPCTMEWFWMKRKKPSRTGR